MNFLIQQEAGIGDIFFLQKIAKKLVQHGSKVLWPIKKEIFPLIRDHLAYPGIEYVDISSSFSTEGYQALEFHTTYKHYPHLPIMVSKYTFYGEEFIDWLDWFEFTRDTKTENDLFYDTLGLKDDEEFILVHKTYSTQPNVEVCKHMQNLSFSNIKVVKTIFKEGTNLLSWCKVIEKAKEIHSVDTSLIYIIEKLKTTDKLHMYSKWSPSSFFAIEGIFKKPWVYHNQ
jgi:hypothetical protein